MSFITDNPGKWLLWQPGKRMALASQSQVPPAVPVCSNSPLWPLPSSTWGEAPEKERKQRAGWKDSAEGETEARRRENKITTEENWKMFVE